MRGTDEAALMWIKANPEAVGWMVAYPEDRMGLSEAWLRRIRRKASELLKDAEPLSQ